ncbi:MAG TPA: ribosomal L7Ae/L30e/S12e/Gadd45 family protein [Candidatus Eisenbergiella intestinipullorum]|nr:ribosomal L7Ae/L30e/S12e/Gadd45 family protein [Candidatus Eisenbergiella intestinipullorum]
MKQNKIFSLLGLATRASAVVSGEFMTEKSVKEGRARLVIVGSDASDNTKKNFLNMCAYYHVPCFLYGTKEELGHAMGKEMRASLAVTDEGFAKNLIGKLEATG